MAKKLKAIIEEIKERASRLGEESREEDCLELRGLLIDMIDGIRRRR